VQKHKSWGCSGKRDPTAYIKKNQLVTPSGVDHDFNFISGIEQSRDRKGEQLQGRSIQDAQSRSARLNQPAFRNRLQSAQVDIEYAPLGMSRQKLNRTTLTKVCITSVPDVSQANTARVKSKRINWTVEWLHDDKTSTIGTIFDDEQIQNAYLSIYLKRTGGLRRKRKRDDGKPMQACSDVAQGISTPTSEIPNLTNDPPDSSTVKRGHEVATNKEPLSSLITNDSQTAGGAAAVTTTASHDQDGMAIELDVQQGTIVTKDESNDVKTSLFHPVEEPDLYYYLVKPRTSGPEKVLIPLSPSDTFLTCLQGQTVIEFPTVQVLLTASDALPAGFITEEQYRARYTKEAHEMDQLIQEEGTVEPDVDGPPDNLMKSRSSDISNTPDVGAVPNPSILLATLERDISDMQQK
jgi:hypothetical protein